jgi:hypothetical protein
MQDAAIDKITNSNAKPVVHSDRGENYRWPGSLSRIDDAKLVRSMSRKGCSPANDAREGFSGRLTIKMFYARDSPHSSIDHFMVCLDAYIRWYNRARIKISWGARSAIEQCRSLRIAVHPVKFSAAPVASCASIRPWLNAVHDSICPPPAPSEMRSSRQRHWRMAYRC